MMIGSLRRFFEMTAREDRGCLFVDPSSQTERRITYAQMYREAEKWAEELRRLPLRRRFLAAVWMEPSPEYLQAVMAIVLADGIPVPVHPSYKRGEAWSIIDKVEAEAVLLSRSKVWFAGVKERRYIPPAETAVVFMSSGSTGRPKGVLLSDRNLLSNVGSILDYVRLTEEDRVLLSKSLAYSSTITGEWLAALQAGAHLQMTPGFFHPFQMVRFIREYRTTFACTVPSFLIPLIKSDKWRSGDLISLQKMTVVGGPIAQEMLHRLHARLPWTQIMPCYGLTEAAPRVTYLPSRLFRDKADSAGIPVSGVSVGIYRDGRPVRTGETGEIVVRGPNVMLGYYDDRELTASVLTDYGLRTSDMGRIDQDGCIYVTGRLDHAINVAGHTIYPEKLEKVMFAHPMVREAAAAGKSDPVWGQIPVAFVVPDDPAACERELIDELFRYCREHLSAAHHPKDIFLVRQLPKTKSGKLDRAGLQSMMKEEPYAVHPRR